MGYEGRVGYEIKASELTTEMKVFLQKGWFNVTYVDVKPNFVLVDVSAPFLGGARITLDPDEIVMADKRGTFGHKHEDVIMNDSSQAKPKKDDKMPGVVNTQWGSGSTNDN